MLWVRRTPLSQRMSVERVIDAAKRRDGQDSGLNINVQMRPRVEVWYQRRPSTDDRTNIDDAISGEMQFAQHVAANETIRMTRLSESDKTIGIVRNHVAQCDTCNPPLRGRHVCTITPT